MLAVMIVDVPSRAIIFRQPAPGYSTRPAVDAPDRSVHGPRPCSWHEIRWGFSTEASRPRKMSAGRPFLPISKSVSLVVGACPVRAARSHLV